MQCICGHRPSQHRPSGTCTECPISGRPEGEWCDFYVARAKGSPRNTAATVLDVDNLEAGAS